MNRYLKPSSIMQLLGWALRTDMLTKMARPLRREISDLFRDAVGWDIIPSMPEQFLHHQQLLHLLHREIRLPVRAEIPRYLHLGTDIGHPTAQLINLRVTLEFLILLEFGINQ
jgi:hypothetical protein